MTITALTKRHPVLTYYWAFATSLWIIVAAVAAANRGQLSHQPLQGQVS